MGMNFPDNWANNIRIFSWPVLMTEPEALAGVGANINIEPTIEEQENAIRSYEQEQWLNNIERCAAECDGDTAMDTDAVYTNEREHLLYELALLKAGCLFRNFTRLKKASKILKNKVINQEYEYKQHLCCYLLTFKPYDHNYDPDKDGMEIVRKLISKNVTEDYVITRETQATKIHFNAMVYSWDCTLEAKLNNKATKHYKIYCKGFPIDDRVIVWNYIFKEARQRLFKHRLDYYEKKLLREYNIDEIKDEDKVEI